MRILRVARSLDPGGVLTPVAIVVLLITLIHLTGCGSSGIAPTLEEWRLSEFPVTRIGVVDGEPAYQLDRVAGVLRLSDGRVVVANAGTQELRYYDAGGGHLVTVGGAGSGPGEFRGLASIARLPGDSLLALDQGSSQLSVFGPDGEFVRSWFVESPGRGHFPQRVLAGEDGSVLVAFVRGHMPGDPSGVIRNSAPLLRYSADGEFVGMVAEVPGEEWFYSPEHQVMTFRPFGRKGHLAVAGTSVFVGGGESYEVEVYDLSGELRRTFSQPRDPIPVTAEEIRRYREALVESLRDPESKSRQERLNAVLPFPETMPAYASILADDEGSLWVEEYRYPAEAAARWSVLDREGRLMATITVPQGFTPQVVMDGLVAGIYRDELDVEYVEIYELIRG